MSTITAKAIVAKVDEQDAEQTAIHLQADYGTDAEPINQEWARYTPTLNILMVVKNEIATHFPILGKFKVTFELDDEDKAPAEQPSTPAAPDPTTVQPATAPTPPAPEAPAPADPTPAPTPTTSSTATTGTTEPPAAIAAPSAPTTQPDPTEVPPAQLTDPKAALIELTRETATEIARDTTASPQMVSLAHRLLDALEQLEAKDAAAAPAAPAYPAPVDVTAIAPATVTHQ